jgi:RNA polymerase sigma factor (sigma-70 family)
MENLNLIKKIAMSFSLTTGIDFDDLCQEASLAYLEAMKTYNPDKGKISTYVWHCIHNHLKNYIKIEQEENNVSIDDVEIFNTCEPVSFFNSLSMEALEIAKIIIGAPKNFIYQPKDMAIRKLYKILTLKGWQSEKIQSGFSCLRKIYS